MSTEIYFFILYCLNIARATYYGYGLNQNNYNYDSPSLKYYGPFINENAKFIERKANEVESWPEPQSLEGLGQVSGVATCPLGNVYLFQRANVVWNSSSFDINNIYNYKNGGAIANDTVVVLDPIKGRIIKSWGHNKFYMPHGISIDPQGNIWLTDVALHQIFRFKRDQLDTPDLVLGEAFVPGNDDKHFCMPTDVAISSSGIVYISDGYCNSRVLIFSPEGNIIGQFGTMDGMTVPHSLTLLEHEDLICVADRENSRVLCFTAGLSGDRKAGKLVFNLQHPLIGHVYAVDHIGDIILAVSIPADISRAPQGVSFDLATEQPIDIWEPKSKFSQPHDISVSNDGSFYVSEISLAKQKRIYKFVI